AAPSSTPHDRPGTGTFNRGLYHYHQGDFTKAQADLVAAQELSPGSDRISKLLNRVEALVAGVK
ncbi:MAG: tetratricopeptide repeat protein, partial [bacterium]